MSAFAEVTRWFWKNPGIWSIADVADATGISRSTVGAALTAMSAMEPKLCVRMKQGVYMSRPPEAEQPPPPFPEPAAQPELLTPDLAWEEFTEIPDDRDLYPPFKVQVIEKRRSRRGGIYFRIRDERGKRGALMWDDDDD
jgi:hypothetical protein